MQRRFPLLTALAVLAFLVTLLASGKNNDYVSYVQQWGSIWSGQNPWPPEVNVGTPNGNAYGPAYVALAPLFHLHPLLPKLVFGLGWVLGLGLLLHLARPLSDRGRTWLLWTYVLSPFYWIDVALYGHFDTLVAVLVVASAVTLLRGRDVVAALCFAVAVLLKFVPLALLPVFALAGGRPRFRFTFLTLALVAAGLGACYAVWGLAVFNPFLVSAGRGPKLLSIFAFFWGEFSPFRLWGGDAGPLMKLSMPLMTIGALAAAGLHWLKNLNLLFGAALAALVTLTFYKVGHIQFYALPLVLLTAWLADTGFRPLEDPALARALKWLFGFFAGISLLYTWTGAFHFGGWEPFREVIGLPTFVLEIYVLKALVQHACAVPCPSLPVNLQDTVSG